MDQDSPNTDFLYDFLYVDKPRVSSWFAQLFNDGVLTNLKRTSTTSSGATGAVTVGVPGVAKGNTESKSGAEEGHERNFNPEWSLPLTLLDALDEQQFIHRGITDVEIGSLVLVSGSIQLMDIRMLQQIWTPAAKMMAAQTKITHKNKSELASQKALLGTFGDIAQALPPAPQICLRDRNGEAIWATLMEAHMTVNTTTLAMAHGANLQGEWHILGALDAKPDEHGDNDNKFHTGEMAAAMTKIMGTMRNLIGRSPDAYAITPILIFRKTVKTMD